jgi:ketosteroid isomerase-like protein
VDPRHEYGNPGGRDVEVEVVRAIYDAFARRDVEAALASIATDFAFFPQGTAQQTGRTAAYVGHAGVRAYFRDAAQVWEDLTLHADDIRAAAGGVVVFGHVVGRVDGRRVERRVIWTWQIRDGRAVAMRVNDLGAA